MNINDENPGLPPIASGPPPLPVGPPPIRGRKKASPIIRIVFLVVFFVAGFVGFRVVQFALYVKSHPHKAEPGELEFREANKEIIAGNDGVVFGNNAEARALAEEYSKSLKVLRDDLIAKDNPTAVGALEGDFLTYCQLNEDSCVFLVHVPELRRFTGDAKEAIVDAAWISAQTVIHARLQQSPKTVVVGVKGLMFYDAILIGDYVADPQSGKDGIAKRGESGLQDMKLFYPYFAAKDKPPSSKAENNLTK